MSAEEGEFVPEEIEDQCTECHKALAAVERLVKPVLSLNRSHLEDKVSMLTTGLYKLNYHPCHPVKFEANVYLKQLDLHQCIIGASFPLSL